MKGVGGEEQMRSKVAAKGKQVLCQKGSWWQLWALMPCRIMSGTYLAGLGFERRRGQEEGGRRVSQERVASLDSTAWPDYVSAVLSWSGLGLSSLEHASSPRMAMPMTIIDHSTEQ